MKISKMEFENVLFLSCSQTIIKPEKKQLHKIDSAMFSYAIQIKYNGDF